MFLLATLTLFVDELKKRMRSILGGDGARVWMDYQLAANDQVTDKSGLGHPWLKTVFGYFAHILKRQKSSWRE
jgi:hypothetical protein